MEFKKFESIEQFRSAIKEVRDYSYRHSTPIPTLTFKGTVKIHGTNAGIRYNYETDELICQSRERIITPFSDNAGFAAWVNGPDGNMAIRDIIDNTWIYFNQVYHTKPKELSIYGEWAGKGVQSGVGVSELNKKFFIFRIEVDGVILDITQFKTPVFNPDYGVFSIYDFPTWEIEIDFNNPEAVQNKLVELTMAVEAECPVAKKFGVSGIGEGIVWNNAQTGVTFKVKGEKHSASKVKALKELAPVDVALFNAMAEFTDAVCSESRLQQGIHKLQEMGLEPEPKNTGAYIKWVVQDVLKEEGDTIVANGFDWKKLSGNISNKARQYFLNHLG